MAVELLAPAGAWDAMVGAIDAGADAVYVGGEHFGARAYAGNFSDEELCGAIDYVHLHKCKLYLAVNTLLKNRELPGQLEDYLLPLYGQGLDGVIVQDFGVFSYIRRRFPGLPIHASTQMAITGVNAAKMLERAGAARIVAARELTLDELRQIREETSLEIEAFIHGSLCYCYSGQCLFSSMLGGRSGNRGRCAQPCRLPYQCGKNTAHLLSLKDLCTLELLPEILGAGVGSLKIEGRMKKPAYVAGVVSVYRKYLDACLDGQKAADWDKGQLERDKEFLKNLFHRGGFCQGYYKEKPGPSMVAFQNEKKTGMCQVKIRKRKEKIKGNLMLSSGSCAILELSCGDCKVSVTGGRPERALRQPVDRKRIIEQMCKTGDTPFTMEAFRLDMEEELFLPVSQLNGLRRKGVQALEDELLKKYRRLPPASLENDVFANMYPACKNIAGDNVCPSQGTAAWVNMHISKGDTMPTDLHTSQGKGILINQESILLSASCETIGQWQVLSGLDGLGELYLSIPLFEELRGEKGAGYFRCLSGKRDWLLALPHVVRQRDLSRLLGDCGQAMAWGCRGFLVRNLESFWLLAQNGWASLCHLDAGLYTYNDWSVDFWREQKVASDMVPLELNQKEIAHRDNSMSYMMVYGYIPLMVSAQCVRKNLGKCGGGRNRRVGLPAGNGYVQGGQMPVAGGYVQGGQKCVILRDRYQKKFPVQSYCSFCYNVVYNSLPYGLLEYKQVLQKMGLRRFFLSFTLESPSEAQEVAGAFIQAYGQGWAGEGFSFTKGHANRGVE